MAQTIIDISEHNGNIDFSKPKGVQGYIIRAGFWNVKGYWREDLKFKRNVQQCEARGIPYGFYCYSYATTQGQATSEVQAFLKAIKGYKPLLPVAMDYEDADGWKRGHGNPSIQQQGKWCAMQMREIERAGYYAMWYASRSWYVPMIQGDPSLRKYDYWMADWYIAKHKPGAPKLACGLWQYTSDGQVPGIGRCDVNTAYVDYPTVIKNKGLNGWKKAGTDPLKSIATSRLVEDTLMGRYGVGKEREQQLGLSYGRVQEGVNQVYEYLAKLADMEKEGEDLFKLALDIYTKK